MNYIQCADDHRNEAWLQRRMTAAEAAWWRWCGDTLEEAAKYSCRLSWAAKAGSLSVTERLWLGHHQNEESRMALTYPRDAFTAILIKLRRILESVKQGSFDPDLPREFRELPHHSQSG